MSKVISENVPAKTVEILYRTDWSKIQSDPGSDPVITVHRVKRVDGFVEEEKDIIRKLSQVAGEPFGNTSLLSLIHI